MHSLYLVYDRYCVHGVDGSYRLWEVLEFES